MVTLTKIFSRERPFFYFCMWNDTDRKGYKKFADHKIKNNLFVFPGSHQKTQVWYDEKELEEFREKLSGKLNKEHFSKITIHLDRYWNNLYSYLSEEKKITTAKEFAGYYSVLVKWWSAMTIVFGIPDLEAAPSRLKKEALGYRTLSEKYSDKMTSIVKIFFEKYFPQYLHIFHLLSPPEIIELTQGKMTELQIQNIKRRENGFAMFNNSIYLLDELENILSRSNIQLNKSLNNTADTAQITGFCAFRGETQGVVKIVLSKTDLQKIKKGDILVTQMTSPDYLSAMKLASGIITDEGGITCHAAITARELKKPCVIGTKHATNIFNDGDIVKISSEKVTIIARTKKIL